MVPSLAGEDRSLAGEVGILVGDRARCKPFAHCDTCGNGGRNGPGAGTDIAPKFLTLCNREGVRGLLPALEFARIDSVCRGVLGQATVICGLAVMLAATLTAPVRRTAVLKTRAASRCAAAAAAPIWATGVIEDTVPSSCGSTCIFKIKLPVGAVSHIALELDGRAGEAEGRDGSI